MQYLARAICVNFPQTHVCIVALVSEVCLTGISVPSASGTMQTKVTAQKPNVASWDDVDEACHFQVICVCDLSFLLQHQFTVLIRHRSQLPSRFHSNLYLLKCYYRGLQSICHYGAQPQLGGTQSDYFFFEVGVSISPFLIVP